MTTKPPSYTKTPRCLLLPSRFRPEPLGELLSALLLEPAPAKAAAARLVDASPPSAAEDVKAVIPSVLSRFRLELANRPRLDAELPPGLLLGLDPPPRLFELGVLDTDSLGSSSCVWANCGGTYTTSRLPANRTGPRLSRKSFGRAPAPFPCAWARPPKPRVLADEAAMRILINAVRATASALRLASSAISAARRAVRNADWSATEAGALVSGITRRKKSVSAPRHG